MLASGAVRLLLLLLLLALLPMRSPKEADDGDLGCCSLTLAVEKGAEEGAGRNHKPPICAGTTYVVCIREAASIKTMTASSGVCMA